MTSKKERAAYRTLSIPVSSSYEEVKGTFLRLALVHHPDKTGKNSVDEFIKYRTAFETIRKATNKQKHKHKQRLDNDDDYDDDEEDDMADEEMQTWFYEETGEFLSFQMDQDTIDEVIKAFTTLSPGGRDPGEWEMARQLTEREARRKAGDLDDDDDDDGPLLQLTGSMNSATTIRRRQRRWAR
jgi:DnaJ-class molecular chaperone